MRFANTRTSSSSGRVSAAARQMKARATATAVAPPKAAPVQQSRHMVDGVVRYMQAPADGEQAYQYLYGVPEGKKASNFERAEHTVPVTDLHSVPQEFTLENNGFELRRLQIPANIDWQNEQEVQSRYYPLVEKLLLEVTGGSRVHVFDHTLRQGQISQGEDIEQEQDQELRKPVPLVHVNYTTTSGPQRLDALLPEEADKLKETPFAVVQVWRPLGGPVQDSPLGMIDASTVAKEDLVEYALHFPCRSGYNYGVKLNEVKHNPKHKWYFAKGMTTEEAYVFVCYDSRDGRARFTPHTGFADLTAPADAPMRESIELRSYVFWEHEPKQQYAARL